MNRHFSHQLKGQGLLEIIIALGVLITGAVSVLSLVIGNLTTERFGIKRYQALNLAREGIEAVKNIRDSNWLDRLVRQSAWEGIRSGNFVLVFYPETGVKALLESSDPALFLNEQGVYTQSEEGEKTSFSRLITISNIICGNEIDADKCNDFGLSQIGIKVVSKVEWFETGRRNEVVLTEKLYDWK